MTTDTSLEAYRLVDAVTQCDRLYQLLVEAGPKGLTAFHAARMVGMAPNQVATRFEELRDTGKAVRLVATRETSPGYRAHIHVADVFAPDDAELLYRSRPSRKKADAIVDAAIAYRNDMNLVTLDNLLKAVEEYVQ